MKTYTKTGDDGTTALYGGKRVPKHELRVECYGTLDELNAHLGLLADQNLDPEDQEILRQIQHHIFALGAMLATPEESAILKNGNRRLQMTPVDTKKTGLLEDAIDAIESTLDPMTHFILPGGHPTVSICHIARCVCRRGERLISALHTSTPLDRSIIPFVNRLSDYLFVLARKLSKNLQIEEIKWIPKK